MDYIGNLKKSSSYISVEGKCLKNKKKSNKKNLKILIKYVSFGIQNIRRLPSFHLIIRKVRLSLQTRDWSITLTYILGTHGMRNIREYRKIIVKHPYAKQYTEVIMMNGHLEEL